MSTPVRYFAYAAAGGGLLAGQLGSQVFEYFRRRNADGTTTDLLGTAPAITEPGGGAYEFVIPTAMLTPGCKISWVINTGPNTVNTREEGDVNGADVGPDTSSTSVVVPSSTRIADFHIKKGDLFPAIRQKLKRDDGSAIDLTGASVNFRMREPGQAIKVNAAATIIDIPTGDVSYQWAGTDTDTEALYDGEWVISRGGSLETVPANGYVKIAVGKSLA
jgi:hypothetical protein